MRNETIIKRITDMGFKASLVKGVVQISSETAEDGTFPFDGSSTQNPYICSKIDNFAKRNNLWIEWYSMYTLQIGSN